VKIFEGETIDYYREVVIQTGVTDRILEGVGTLNGREPFTIKVRIKATWQDKEKTKRVGLRMFKQILEQL